MGIFIGYASYYLLRKNFSLAMSYLLNIDFSKTQLELTLSDRCNLHYGFLNSIIASNHNACINVYQRLNSRDGRLSI